MSELNGLGPWQLTRGGGRVDNWPLGWDAENFILDNCQYVVYIRKDPRFFCTQHWDQATQSPRITQAHCPVCWGFGHKVTVSIVPSRISLGEAKVSPKVTDLRTEIGFVEYYESSVFFPRAVRPALEDLVLICEWNCRAQDIGKVPHPRVINVSTIYEIKQINDRFERELSWFSCGVEGAEVHRLKFDLGLPYMTNLWVLDTLTSWSEQTNFW